MAFCTKCGKQLADGEICNCTEAAAPVETAPTKAAPQAEAPAQAEAPKAKKPKKKKTAVLAGLIAVLVLAVVILVVILTSRPYMKPIKDFMSAINNRNTSYIELTETLMPDFGAKELNKLYKKMLKSDDVVESQEDSVQTYENYYENATDAFGEWELTFELKKATKFEPNEDEFENVQDAIEDYYKNNLDSAVDYFEDILDDEDELEDWSDNYDVTEKEAKAILEAAIKYYQAYRDLEVTEVYEVKGEFIIKTADDEYDTDTCKLYMAKVNGDWVYYSLIEGDLNFDGDDYDYFYFIRSFLRSGKLFSYAL